MRSPILLFVLILASIDVHAERLPKGLTNICYTRIKDQKEADQWASDPRVRIDCRKRIQEAFDKCFAPESDQPLSKIQHGAGGAREAAQALTDAHRMGREQTTERALLCRDERDAVIKQCEADINQVKTDLKNNSSSSDSKMQELNALPYSGEREAAIREASRQGGEAYDTLNKELSATRIALKQAERQLASWSVCKANQARIHARAEAEATTVLTAVSDGQATPAIGEVESNTERQEAGDVGRYGKPIKGLASTMGDKLANSVAGVPRTIATTAMGAYKFKDNYDTYSKPPEESIGTVTGNVQKVIGYVKPQYALRTTGVGTFIAASLSSDPVSKCSELYFDAVQAYDVGCYVYRPSSPSANEMAISTLSQP